VPLVEEMSPDPADETNRLLVDIKHILLAMTLNTSIPDRLRVENESMPFNPPTTIKWTFMLWASSIAIAVRSALSDVLHSTDVR
jgi:hypothetical protein